MKTIGLLENLLEQLTDLNAQLRDGVSVSGQSQPEVSEAEPQADSAPRAKKRASKKVASKKRASKKSKADDLSDVNIFKKRLFEVCEECGVDDALATLKAYFKESDYAVSDEVEPEDRAQFLADLKDSLSGESEESEYEI